MYTYLPKSRHTGIQVCNEMSHDTRYCMCVEIANNMSIQDKAHRTILFIELSSFLLYSPFIT